jgi:PAS domain S-box-containing protein
MDMGAGSPDEDSLLEGCLELSNVPSLMELNRELDYWLVHLFEVRSWKLTCSADVQAEPLISMSSLNWEEASAKPAQTCQQIAIPFAPGSSVQGVIELALGTNQPDPQRLRQLLRGLAAGVDRLGVHLRSLAQTAELRFMHLVVPGGQHKPYDLDLDALASTLLKQLGVSSFQVLVNQPGIEELSWGVSSRRINLDLTVQQRFKLWQLAEVTLSPSRDDRQPYYLVKGEQLHHLQQRYDLPYLAQLKSMVMIPITNGELLLGVVIIGEERSWSRQPIFKQSIVASTLLAQSIGESLTQSQMAGELIERGQFMHALVNALDDAVLTTRNGTIISWNEGAEALFGYRANEVLGRPFTDVLPAVPTEVLTLTAHDGLLANKKRIAEWRMCTTEQHELVLECTVSTLQGFSSDVPTVLYVFRDTKKEREIESLKDELLSIVSHELRTPLNGIYGFGRLLLERPHMSEATRREALQSLHHSIERLTRMAEDFIDLARSRRKGLPLELERVDLTPIIRSAIHELKYHHVDHVIRLRVRGRLPAVMVDGLRIKQVLDNLVGNAVKYAPKGTTITINVRQRGPLIVTSVADQGPGIPEASQERIFEAFYRAANARHQRASGVGLGLSIVKLLVEAHKGTVTVRSRLGVGSTFTFTLPVAEEPLLP